MDTDDCTGSPAIKAKIFRRPTNDDLGDTARENDSLSTKSDENFGRPDQPSRTWNSESLQHRPLPSEAKQVRFHHVESGDESGFRVPVSRQSDSYDTSHALDDTRSDEDATSGASSPSTDLSEFGTSSPRDRLAITWSQPNDAAERADSESRTAKVEDYESSVDSDETRETGYTVSPVEANLNHAPVLFPSGEASALKTQDKDLHRSTSDYRLKSDSRLRVASNSEYLKQVIRDEIAAVLRYNDDRVEQGMHERLAQSGFMSSGSRRRAVP